MANEKQKKKTKYKKKYIDRLALPRAKPEKTHLKMSPRTLVVSDRVLYLSLSLAKKQGIQETRSMAEAGWHQALHTQRQTHSNISMDFRTNNLPFRPQPLNSIQQIQQNPRDLYMISLNPILVKSKSKPRDCHDQ